MPADARPQGRSSLHAWPSTLRPSWRRLGARARECGRRRVHAAAAADPFEQFLLERQESLLKETEVLQGGGAAFVRDRWQRDPGDANAGYGITAVLEGGDLLEKAAVNVSIVAGTLSPERARAMSSRGRAVDAAGGQPYSAAALSLVYHPAHPLVPTLRADVRRFQVDNACWYGGGCDLTPAYLFEEDAAAFHAFWRALCDRHGPGLYARYKAWCDEYFYLPARREHRGLGGLFFDDITGGGEGEPADALQFVREVAEGVLPSWRDIAARRRAMAFGQRERDWQLLRRGRYLEFNLLYDRGVRFGLGGRIESVMVSAPPLIAWRYDVRPEPGSPEAALVQALAQPREWAPAAADS